MMSAKFLAASAAGLSMFGSVAAVNHFTVRPSTDVAEIRQCVSKEFSANSFDVSSTSSTRFEGRVAGEQPGGPNIAVVFNADHDTSVMFNQSSMSLQTAQDRLGAIERLADNISRNCMRPST